MEKYILTKTQKGKKYLYEVKDENGNVVSTRTSARNYVACTANGEFYFGRLDLIGKGDHGKGLSRTTEILANPERAYKKQVAYFVPSYRKEWIAENPADEWIARNVNWATERQKELNAIAYLQPGGITPALPVMERKHIYSVSFGKDSLAMLLMAIDKGLPIDEVVFFNIGVEFDAIYTVRDMVLPILAQQGIKYTELDIDRPFYWYMFEKPVCKKDTNIVHKYGYGWCGGNCRWGTTLKLRALKNYIGNNWDYVGIASDETDRIEKERRENKILPLVEMGITGAQALQYCYDRGIYWEQNGIRLYEILDRISCRICRNKNLKELRNIKQYLPDVWTELLDLQTRIPVPFKPGRKNKKTGELIPGKSIHYFNEIWER